MTKSVTELGIVVAPFAALFLYMGITEVMWPIDKGRGTSQVTAVKEPMAPVEPRVVVKKKPKKNRELKKYAGKFESLFERIQKVSATITNVKAKDAGDIENELKGELAVFPACPDPYFSSLDKSLRSATAELQSMASLIPVVAEAEAEIFKATRANLSSATIEQFRAVQKTALNRISTSKTQADKNISDIRNDEKLREMLDALDD